MSDSSDTLFAPLPQGEFRTIIADPPWDYSKKLSGGGTSGYSPVHHSRGGSRGAANHYRTIKTEDIARLPVAEIAATEAHLYLWTTGAFMVEAHQIAESWGFAPKGVIPWIKLKREWRANLPRREGSLDSVVRMGMGKYVRWCAEFVIFCVRGKLPALRHDVLGVLFAERLRHSEKPNELYELVEKVSPPPRLELFARSRKLGYVSWGDELEAEDCTKYATDHVRASELGDKPDAIQNELKLF